MERIYTCFMGKQPLSDPITSLQARIPRGVGLDRENIPRIFSQPKIGPCVPHTSAKDPDTLFGQLRLHHNKGMASRLYRDLVALATNPLPGCEVYLGRNDEGELVLDSWYIRMGLCVEAPIEETLQVPFMLKFPQEYPRRAPTLHCLCRSINHPCVVPGRDGHVVCLTMFETPLSLDGSSRVDAPKVPYSGWTEAFSGLAVLAQLQGFFDAHDDYSVPAARALKKELAAFERDVLPSLTRVEQLPIRRKFVAPVAPPKPVAAGPEASLGTQATENSNSDDGGFTVCMGKRAARKAGKQAIATVKLNGKETTMGKFMCSSCLQMKPESEFSKTTSTAKKRATEWECNGCKTLSESKQELVAATQKSASTQLTKAQLRNLRRAEKRRGVPASHPTRTTQPTPAVEEETKHEAEAAPPAEPKTLQSLSALIANNLPSDMILLETAPATANFVPNVDRQSVRNAGPLGRLSNQLIQQMMLNLKPTDIINLTKTCRLLSQVGADGYIWKRMIQLFYPDCKYWSETPQGWRSIFTLQANAIHESDLLCWRTKRSHKEDVLGILLKFTMNPVTGKTDYIYSDMELISRTAYMTGKSTSVWGEQFQRWLPLYIDADHFNRALVSITTTITSLCPGAAIFRPQLVLEVLPKLMNTIVVLLADEATTEAQTTQALKGYFMIHRLFIALVQKYPALRNSIYKTLHDFVSNERNRVKSACPALGELIPLVCVSQSVGWKDVGPVLIQESFDRSILWTCRDVPKLARHRQRSDTADMQFLSEVFAAKRVGLRLHAFHVCFLRILGTPAGMNIDRVANMYDSLLGVPSAHLVSRLRRELARVTNMTQYNEFFQAVCLPTPTPVQLTNMLADSVNASLRKNYHNLNTNFAAIQRSGVSNILLRGKSYETSCFVIDVSGSMGMQLEDGSMSRLDYVKQHLRDALKNHLTHRHQFNVVFFDHDIEVWENGMVQATAENINLALRFVDQAYPRGGTIISQAVEFAYTLPNIQAVYLLSDGESDWHDMHRQLARLSKNKTIPCHTTAFMTGEDGAQLLSDIAAATGGEFLNITEKSFQS